MVVVGHQRSRRPGLQRCNRDHGWHKSMLKRKLIWCLNCCFFRSTSRRSCSWKRSWWSWWGRIYVQVGLHLTSFKSSLHLLVHLVQLAVVGEIKHLSVGVLVKHPLHHLLQLLYGEVDALQVHHLQLAHSLGQVVRVGEGQHGVGGAIVAANVELSQV